MGTRIYIGNLNARVTETDLEDEFKKFGYVRNVWIARKPPGFAFVVMDDNRDAEDAIRRLDGLRGWKVELARRDLNKRAERGGGGRGNRDASFNCYQCGAPGHLARDCPIRRQSRNSKYHQNWSRSPSHGRNERSRSRSRERYRRERSVSQVASESHDPDRREVRSEAVARSSPRLRSRERSKSLSPLPVQSSPYKAQDLKSSPVDKRTERLENGHADSSLKGE